MAAHIEGLAGYFFILFFLSFISFSSLLSMLRKKKDVSAEIALVEKDSSEKSPGKEPRSEFSSCLYICSGDGSRIFHFSFH